MRHWATLTGGGSIMQRDRQVVVPAWIRPVQGPGLFINGQRELFQRGRYNIWMLRQEEKGFQGIAIIFKPLKRFCGQGFLMIWKGRANPKVKVQRQDKEFQPFAEPAQADSWEWVWASFPSPAFSVITSAPWRRPMCDDAHHRNSKAAIRPIRSGERVYQTALHC